jgi:hypothetical protein
MRVVYWVSSFSDHSEPRSPSSITVRCDLKSVVSGDGHHDSNGINSTSASDVNFRDSNRLCNVTDSVSPPSGSESPNFSSAKTLPNKLTKPAETPRLRCCKFCSKTFTTLNGYMAHLMETSKFVRVASATDGVCCVTSAEGHVCRQCGSSFKESTELTEHTKSHGRTQPYSCELCNVTFSVPSHLLVHMKSHTGAKEKKYECDVCKKFFATPAYLKMHQRRHDSYSYSRPKTVASYLQNGGQGLNDSNE